MERKRAKINVARSGLSLSSSDSIISDVMLEIVLESKVGRSSAKNCVLTKSGLLKNIFSYTNLRIRYL